MVKCSVDRSEGRCMTERLGGLGGVLGFGPNLQPRVLFFFFSNLENQAE